MTASEPNDTRDERSDDQTLAERFGLSEGKGYSAIIVESYSGARAPYVNVQLDSQPTALKADVGTDGVALDVVAAEDDVEVSSHAQLSPEQAEILARDLLEAAEAYRQWDSEDDE